MSAEPHDPKDNLSSREIDMIKLVENSFITYVIFLDDTITKF